MKKILGLLVLSLILFGCATENPNGTGKSPNLISLITQTGDTSQSNPGWIPKRTFAIDEKVYIRIQGADSDKDIKKLVGTVKKDNAVIVNIDRDFSPGESPFTWNIGNWTFNFAGYYTMELRIIDAKNNKSNIGTVNFTVQ
jgi:hypothetical protein